MKIWIIDVNAYDYGCNLGYVLSTNYYNNPILRESYK